MSNFNQMRQGLHEGLRASTRIDLRRAVVAHADAPPGHETTEQQLKDISIACAGLDTPLSIRSGNGGEVIALEEGKKGADEASDNKYSRVRESGIRTRP